MISRELHAINQIRAHLRDMKASRPDDAFRIERIEFYLDILEKRAKVENEAINDLMQTMRENRNAGDSENG